MRTACIPTLSLLVALLCKLAAAAADSAISAGFDADGLTSLRVAGVERLAAAAPLVRRVVATDRARDRHAESQKGAMYAADEREFSALEIGEPQRRFDAKTRTIELTHAWGTVAIRYTPAPDRLDITVDIANRSDRFIELVDLALLELALGVEAKTDMPSSLAGWAMSGCNLGAPDLARVRHPGGQILWLSRQPARPLRQKLAVQAGGRTTVSVVAGDAKGGTEIYDGQWDTRTLPPGGTDRYELSLRFGPADASPFVLAEDLLQAFGKAVPATLDWPDRRPIAAVHVADGRSSARNPRGWVHGIPLPADWDINAPDSHATFRAAALLGAENIVQVARRLGVQGVVVWQIEGMEWKDSAYYGNPHILPYVAPEMDAVADDFFAVMRNAGLRVGITIRPVIHFPGDAEKSIWSPEGVPWEKMTMLLPRGGGYEVPENCLHLYAAASAWCMLTRLDEKIAYAKKRWGATLFYIDTNNIWRPRDPKAENGGWAAKMLTAELFRQLAERHPDVLLIPEHEYLEYYAHAAPHSQPPGWGAPTGPDVRAAYPESFCVLTTTDEKHILGHLDRYVEAIVSGDLYLPHGWFAGSWQVLSALYQPAAALAPFQIRVATDHILLGEDRVADARALGEALQRRLAGRPPLKQRRAFVLFDAAVAPERLGAVLDAVTQAGGVIVWTQPTAVDWRAYWRADHPLQCRMPEARAILLPGAGEAKIAVFNASPEPRDVAVAINAAGLGLAGIKTLDDAILKALPGLAEPPEPPPAAPDALALGAKALGDDWTAEMIQGIEADAADAANDLDVIALDLDNFRRRGDTVELRVPPFGWRVLRIAPRWPVGKP